MKKQTKNDFKKRKGMSECAIKPIDTNIQEVIRIVDKDKVYYAQREVVDLIRNKCLAEVEKIIYERMDWIESDGWENYNPIDVLRDIKEEFKQKLQEMEKC